MCGAILPARRAGPPCRKTFPLSPVLRGEGGGEGLFGFDVQRSTLAVRRSHLNQDKRRTSNGQLRTSNDEPLTLTLSPEYRGEGTRAVAGTGGRAGIARRIA